MAKERVSREPDWCMAARAVGTYSSRVEIPKPTCRKCKQKILIATPNCF